MSDSRIPIVCRYISLVVLRGDHVLLLKRTGTRMPGEWCQVAGGIEPGEKAWETAVRELHEETQLVPERLYSADILEQFYEPDRDRIAVVPVFVAFVAPEAEPILNEEHSDWMWTTIDKARELVPFPGQRKMLEEIREIFIERPPSPLLHIPLAQTPSSHG